MLEPLGLNFVRRPCFFLVLIHYELVCQALRLLHIAGMTVTLRQYPSGDALSDSMLSDVDQWMMEVMAEQQQASIIGC